MSATARKMAEAPIFEALAAEVVGTTMGLPIFRYPAVRTLRAAIRYRERIPARPRATLAEVIDGRYWPSPEGDARL